MATEIIAGYLVYTKPGENYYRIGLVNSGGQVFFKDLSGPEELRTLVDLLRNENSITFNPEVNMLSVGYEYVGEED